MSDTPITRQAFNEAEKLSTFAHQRRFLFDKMERMERESTKLREQLATAVEVIRNAELGDGYSENAQKSRRLLASVQT